MALSCGGVEVEMKIKPKCIG